MNEAIGPDQIIVTLNGESLRVEDMEAWIAEGEALFKAVDEGRYGLMASMAFAMGKWWADRPWRRAKR